jgi:V8-like Glu-specific endopeptidase
VVDGTIDAEMKKLSWQSASLLLVIGTALIVATVLVLAAALPAAPVADRSAQNQPRTGALAERANAAPSSAVGALFTRQNGHLGQHFCTASAVASRAGNLLITAAHCVTGVNLSPPGSVVFAPGYSDGRFPHGLWAVTRKFVDAQWTARQDPDDDVAFLEVRPLSGSPDPAGSLRHVAGAERIRFDAPLPTPIQAIGYPDGSSQAVSCATRATSFRLDALTQVRFVCPGFTDGTSGGPFLSDFSRATGIGAIIGVIGGYQQGGDSPSISYSSAFTAGIRALYEHVLKLA